MTNYNLVFGQVTGNVKISISPRAIIYTANATVVNGTIVGPSQQEVQIGGTFVVTVDANIGYELSSSGVSVLGATLNRIQADTTQTTPRYDILFKDVTGNVSVTITLNSTDSILGNWVLNNTLVPYDPQEEQTGDIGEGLLFNIEFTSYNVGYSRMLWSYTSDGSISYSTLEYDDKRVYNSTTGWELGNRFITITGISNLTNRDVLIGWLNKNAVRNNT